MGEEEKVKAIHDYLIYHANYVNNGDYRPRKTGHMELVEYCYIKKVSARVMRLFLYDGNICWLECRFVSGTADGGGHAWNQVKVNGKWY